MFSTMPSTGTLTFLNIASPRRASISDRSCGVEMMTAPFSGTFCASVSCASPVPGGMSTTSTSSVPQTTSRSIWVIADITIGPRQIIAVSSSTRKPIDMIDRPKRSIGIILRSSVELGLVVDAGQPRHRRAVDIGIEQPDLEAEIAQAEREIERGGGFADAALAGGDRDDGGDTGDFGLPRHRRAAGRLRRMAVGRDRLHAAGRRDAAAVAHCRPCARRSARSSPSVTPGMARTAALGLRAHVFPGARLMGIDIDREEDLAVGDRDRRQHIRFRQGDAARRLHLAQSTPEPAAASRSRRISSKRDEHRRLATDSVHLSLWERSVRAASRVRGLQSSIVEAAAPLTRRFAIAEASLRRSQNGRQRRPMLSHAGER